MLLSHYPNTALLPPLQTKPSYPTTCSKIKVNHVRATTLMSQPLCRQLDWLVGFKLVYSVP